jgi:hypothetical protein
MSAFPYSLAWEARIEALETYFGLTPSPPQSWEQRFTALEVAAGTSVPSPGTARSWLDRLGALDAAAGFAS